MEGTQHEHWMQHAIELAGVAWCAGEVPIGAIVVQDGQIIGKGYNRSISDHDPSAHAEIVALRAAACNRENYRLPGASIYVTVEPCAMCAGAIVQARIGTVIFGAFDPKAGAAGSVFNVLAKPTLNHQCKVVSGVLEQECASLLQDFFRKKRCK